MEHRLILGGEQYLPFARSCVAKLKKLGLPYANQSFEVDGVSIKVRIEPGHEYIRLDGGYGLNLVTGVVNIPSFPGLFSTSVDPMDYPENHKPVDLCRTQYNMAYESGYVAGTRGWWGKKRTENNSGQVTGEILISGKKITGKIPTDRTSSRAHLPGIIRSEGDTLAFKTLDEKVVARKYAAMRCPASIFTGKCRMYVQAMYGQYSHDGKVSGAGELVSASVGGKEDQFVIDLTYGRPRLKISCFSSAEETAVEGFLPPRPIVIDTHTGVFLDKETGEHWLICMGATLTFYPLIADKAGEKTRPLLRRSVENKMQEVELEHLEAYILSTCKPWASRGQNVPVTAGIFPGYSMGYGWHWDWSGTRADIVTNEETTLDPALIGEEYRTTRYGTTSKHYRVTASLPVGTDVVKTWSASMVLLEEKIWGVERPVFSISEPVWYQNQSIKSLPETGAFAINDAPFYAFYLRDDLQICRVKISLTPEVSETTQPPGFGGPALHGVVGLAGGTYEHRIEQKSYYMAISVAGQSTQAVKIQPTGTSTVKFIRHAGKVINPGEIIGFGAGVGANYSVFSSGHTFNTGDERPPYTADNFDKVFVPMCAPTGWTSIIVEYDTEELLINTGFSGHVVASIPRFDSQAIFVSERQIRVDTTVVDEVRTLRTGVATRKEVAIHPILQLLVSPEGTSTTVVLGVTEGQQFTTFRWNTANQSALFSIAQKVTPPVRTDVRKDYLYSAAGRTSADLGDLWSFFDGLSPTTGKEFWVKSGTSVMNPTVCGWGMNSSVGVPADIPADKAILIGWL